MARVVSRVHATDDEIVAVQYCEVEIFRLVSANDTRGALADGATPIMVAYARKYFELGQTLITACLEPGDNKQQLLTHVSSASPFHGENVLHLAVVYRNVEAIQWLVDTVPDLLDAETTASRYEPGMLCYLGGTPLLFAMAAKLLDGAKAILAAAEKAPPGSPAAKTSIFMTDRFVVYDLPEVYDFAIKYAMTTYPYACPVGFAVDDPTYDLHAFLQRLQPADNLSFNRFLHQYNEDSLTPLTLAAAMGKATIFQHQVMRRATTTWKYGPAVTKMIPLRDVDECLDRSATGPQSVTGQRAKRSAVECLTSYRVLSKCIPKTAQEEAMRGRLEILSTHEIEKLLDKKWEFVGAAMFRRDLCRHVIFTLVFTGSTLFPSHYRDKSSTLADAWVLIVCECYVVGEVVLCMLRELRQVQHHGWRSYTEDSGAAMVDNLLKGAVGLLIVGGIICRACGDFASEDAFVASALLCSYLYMFFFLYGFRATGPFIVMLGRMLKLDVVRFVLVFASILFGFASALYVVVDNRSGAGAFLDRVQSLLLAVFAATFSFDEYRRSTISQLFIFVYMALVVIVLVNLLIAMSSIWTPLQFNNKLINELRRMGNSYDSIIDFAEQRWYAERANVMNSLASGQSAEKRAKGRLKFAAQLVVGQDVEHFVHIEYQDAKEWWGDDHAGDGREKRDGENRSAPSKPACEQTYLVNHQGRERSRHYESNVEIDLESTLAQLAHGVLQHFRTQPRDEDSVNRETLLLGHVTKIRSLLSNNQVSKY
ncbi:hypothetical protein SDRG_11051 [Saprolegnia diclina VS20]|uniref:Ion transport domain-containing protein n=1 Tax=Saprolegnia diclina (strain VS20) TaxID=1156394 RepID=T0RNC5_SAPDV|nr:hypothetical protein SDRG_11051 [Saprolegnia diclina VS20]EQC31452.1 hypothetical protein SDRG_11051 [Saprolegnia diclina VS20]|eukprot:XP_008615293.1 hypothetical protein SDRG_11051 [Saprolegnia diclina VS20]